jgi:hypothetical protein
LDSFGEFFGFWDIFEDIFKILCFFMFFKFKKIMFEKKIKSKNYSVREVRPIMCFYFRDFDVISCSWGSHHDLEISFNLNNYFSFTTTTLDSVNVKISGNLNFRQFETKTIFMIFFQNTSNFHTDWLIFEGLRA